MAIELRLITEKLHKDCLAMNPDKVNKLVEVIDHGNIYVELISTYVDKYCAQNKSILALVTDEFFIDIHTSAILAIGGYYKSACVLLRAAIELGLYTLFFIDHPVEVKIWSSSEASSKQSDMSFVLTLEKVATKEYLTAASKHVVNEEKINTSKEILIRNYRLLSERVHGKFKFLLTATDSPEEVFESFHTTGVESLQALIKLALERADKRLKIADKIPSIKKVK